MSKDLIDSFLYSKNYSKQTVSNYRYYLNRAETILGELSKLTPEEYIKFLDNPLWSTDHRWVWGCCIRSFLRWSTGETNPILKIKLNRSPMVPHRTMTKKQVIQLLTWFVRARSRAVEMTNKYTEIKGSLVWKIDRDLAIALFLLDTGLRISEICRLDIDHVDFERKHFVVLAKGGKYHHGIFSDRTLQSLKNWMAIRGPIAKPGVKNLFVSIGGHTPGYRMTRCGIALEVRRWGIASGLGPLSPHDFRRTFAVMASQNGVPEQILMQAGGWSNSSMIKRYTQHLRAEDFSPYSPVSSLA